MKIAVLCIATNFKVRMKIGNKSLLSQEDKKNMERNFQEIDIWIRNSVENLVPVIVTCFDEIYEMAVQRHYLCFKNEFGQISEGNMIRYGITSYPDAQAYIVISTSETRFFKAEIFENLCRQIHNNPNKIIISKYDNKLTLPMIFSNQYVEPIHSIVDRENGKFVLRSKSKNAIYMAITDEMIKQSDFHKQMPLTQKNVSLNATSEASTLVSVTKPDPDSVVIIRGGGRIGSAIAVALQSYGYNIIITEKNTPTNIMRGLSFAQTVYSSEIEIEGIRAFLVSPSMIQIQKAWNVGAIPVIIDPNLEILQLFDPEIHKISLYDDNIKAPPIDILSYLGNKEEVSSKDTEKTLDEKTIVEKTLNEKTLDEKTLDEKNLDEKTIVEKTIAGNYVGEKKLAVNENNIDLKYKLIALMDSSSQISQNPTNRFMAPITISLRENLDLKENFHYKILTEDGPLHGKIISQKELNVSRISRNIEEPVSPTHDLNDKHQESDDLQQNYNSSTTKTEVKFGLAQIFCSETGIFKAYQKIGDEIEVGSQIGQIEKRDGSVTCVVSSIKGRIIGAAITNQNVLKNDILCIINITGISREDCFMTLPADRSVALSALMLLKGK